MKQVMTFVLLFLLGNAVNAQNYLHLNITEIENQQTFDFCTTEYDSVLIEKEQGCNAFSWRVRVNNGESSVFTTDVLTLIPGTDTENYEVEYQSGCGINYRGFYVNFFTFPLHNPWWAQDYIWKHEGESVTLYGGPDGYSTEWSTGSTNDVITVTEPGIYWVHIYNYCGDLWDTIQVRNSLELYRATVDLETNLNKATWQVTAEQAEYISEVKVYRDGLLVGTTPYEDGYYLDAIGSDNAARNYKIVGVSVEGEDCPIASYEKGTIHTTYYEDVNHNLNMTWNVPYVEEGANGTLTYFQICKYDPTTGDLTVVDQVNAAVTDYTCGVNQFDGGQAVIAAVFSDNKGLEELSFSNLTMDILGIGENSGPSTGSGTLIVYPNPAKDSVTIEGTGTAIITNALGQTIMTKEIDGTETVELPKGLYFVKMNGVTRKIVVE